MKKLRDLSKRKIIIITIIILTLLFLLLSGGKDKNGELVIEKVSQQDVKSEVLALARMNAHEKVGVGAQVSGEIQKLNIQLGDQVKKGDIIALIDKRISENDLQVAKAQLDIAVAQNLSGKSTLDKAKINYNQYKNLYKNGAVSKEEFLSIKVAYDTALNEVKKNKASVEQAQLNLDNKKLNLSYTEIKSPIDGVVVSIPLQEGQTINASMNTPLVAVIAQLDPMEIKAEVSEADINKIKPGMSAIFTTLGNEQNTHEAKVKSIDPAPIHVSNNVTGTGIIYFYTLLDVPNPDNIFKIDQTVNVRILVEERRNVLAISSSALLDATVDHKNTVNVLLPNNKIEKREVTLGLNNGVLVEILDGLKKNESVIVSGEAPTSENNTSNRKKPRPRRS